jgi:hypothetical protein
VLFNNTTGTGNIAVGQFAGFNVTGDNNIDIGHNGVAAESNTIRIGVNQTATYIAGISGATSAGGVAVFVDGAGHLGTITSSARFKEDIQDIGDDSSALMKLRPVRFHYKKDVDRRASSNMAWSPRRSPRSIRIWSCSTRRVSRRRCATTS